MIELKRGILGVLDVYINNVKSGYLCWSCLNQDIVTDLTLQPGVRLNTDMMNNLILNLKRCFSKSNGIFISGSGIEPKYVFNDSNITALNVVKEIQEYEENLNSYNAYWYEPVDKDMANVPLLNKLIMAKKISFENIMTKKHQREASFDINGNITYGFKNDKKLESWLLKYNLAFKEAELRYSKFDQANLDITFNDEQLSIMKNDLVVSYDQDSNKYISKKYFAGCNVDMKIGQDEEISALRITRDLKGHYGRFSGSYYFNYQEGVLEFYVQTRKGKKIWLTSFLENYLTNGFFDNLDEENVEKVIKDFLEVMHLKIDVNIFNEVEDLKNEALDCLDCMKGLTLSKVSFNYLSQMRKGIKKQKSKKKILK